MAGVSDILRGPGKGPKVRDIKATMRAFVSAGCPIENIEVTVTAEGPLIRTKQNGRKAAAGADDIVAKLK